MVYDGEDCIMPILLGESYNEIHCNLLEGEGSFFSGDLIKGNFSLVSEDFVLLTVGTSFDIIGYPLVHAWPFKYFSSFPNGFVSSWMSGCGVVINCHLVVLVGGELVVLMNSSGFRSV